MSISIISSSSNPPDSEEGISIDSSIEICNETDSDIYRIRYKTFIENNNVCLYWNDSYEDVFLKKGETYEFSPYSNLNERDLTSQEINFSIQCCSLKREYIPIGEISLPMVGEAYRLKKEINSNWGGNEINIIISRADYDSDGNSTLEYKCLIKNTTNEYLKDIELKCQLIDEYGAEIENSDSSCEIPPKEKYLIEGSFWRLNESQLANAKLIYAIMAYLPVVKEETQDSFHIDS